MWKPPRRPRSPLIEFIRGCFEQARSEHQQELRQLLHQIKEQFMVTQTQLDQLAQQLSDESTEASTAHDAILAEIQSLKDQISNGTDSNDLDFTGLDAAAGSLKTSIDNVAAITVPTDAPTS